MKKFIMTTALFLSLANYASATDFFTLDNLKTLQIQNEEGCTFVEKKLRWKLYEYKLGSKKIKIRFPNLPNTFEEDSIFYAISEESSCTYILMGLNPPVNRSNSKAVFKAYLDNLDWEILEYQETKHFGHPALDVVVRDEHLINAQRIVVSKKNVYALTTAYEEGDSEQNHKFFVDSFRL